MEDYQIETFSISIFGSGVRRFIFVGNEENYLYRTRRNLNTRNKPIRNNIITINSSRSAQGTTTTAQQRIVYQRSD